MAPTACLVSLVSTVSGRYKNAIGKGSTSSQNIANLKQSTFLYISISYIHNTSFLHNLRISPIS